jgi:hypothetical protein
METMAKKMLLRGALRKDLNTITNTHLLLISGSKATSPRPRDIPFVIPSTLGHWLPFHQIKKTLLLSISFRIHV